MAKRVIAIIEKGSDGYFSCYIENELPGALPIGYGNTADEAKQDLLVAVNELREVVKEKNGEEIPDLDITFKYDIPSFFNHFSYLNVSRVAELAGINPSLMRQYSSGISAAGEKQYNKIRKAIKLIASDLAEATM